MGQYALQFGLPGSQELVIMLLVMVLMLAVPLVVLVVAVRKLSDRGNDERVAELEARVEELESEREASDE